ncbi:Crp/Fnr family transcriptional regulator [Rhizobium leguminosarum]|uniref:Crp/Fnr family transcriptional regulator n=1 Tax=Rhizobium leguminosarum TaxID=384 RepID=UPI001C922DEC|nr:Crp/Fnr family transcriptional regulator [Rhizobium leguminosarum]MBY3044222.1 Crp/Fnr family transcriptional regulator [Rhizobium leguminosarum]
MANINQASVRNKLLQRLPPSVFDHLADHLQQVDLPVKQDVVEANIPTEHVVFVESGLASVIAQSTDNEAVEVGHVGFEGMTGTHVILTADRTPNKTFMQVSGDGLALPTEIFRSLLRSNPPVHDFFLRYVHFMEIQLSHSALATARYNMHERLARWLLMCHDRIEVRNLPLTHELLGLMLGVRRSGVTNQLHILEGVHAIRSTRSNVEIIDRTKLEVIAGGSYGLPEKEYERLLGPVEES